MYLYLELEQDLIMCSLQLIGLLQTRPESRQLRMNLQHLELQPFSALEQPTQHKW
jgi:hypothetical protein